MTDAACRPLWTLSPITEPERPDRLAELLECMADLLVEARRQRLAIAEHCDSDDVRVREGIARVAALEARSETWVSRPRPSASCFTTSTWCDSWAARSQPLTNSR